MRRFILVATAWGLVAGAAGRAEAEVIVSASSVSTNMGGTSGRFGVNNLINQSGLSPGYVSGVTDFDSYVAIATHRSAFGTDWLAGTATGNVDFDLGGVEVIDALAVWNFAANTAFSVTSLKVLASTQSDFSGSTDLGTFPLAVPSPFTPTLSQVLTFDATSARYVRLQILANNGAPTSALGEVAFRSIVPEPSTFIPATLGVLAVLGYGLHCRGLSCRHTLYVTLLAHPDRFST